jgi:hypothetical protein
MNPDTEAILTAFEAVLVAARRGIEQTVHGQLTRGNGGSGADSSYWIVSAHQTGGRSTGKIVIICPDLSVLGEIKDELRRQGHRPDTPEIWIPATGSVRPFAVHRPAHGTIIVTPATA